MLSSSYELDRHIVMLSSSCELDRHCYSDASPCYHHLMFSTDTVKVTNRHAVIILWVRQTHPRGFVMLSSSCEFYMHISMLIWCYHNQTSTNARPARQHGSHDRQRADNTLMPCFSMENWPFNHPVSSTGTSSGYHHLPSGASRRFILWVRRTHSHAIIIWWVRRTHRHVVILS